MAHHTPILPLVLSLLPVLGGGCPGGGHWDPSDDGEPPADDDGDGYAAGDCDDADPSVHPGADDICGDGVDQDCDGVAASCLEGEHSLDDVGTLISSVALGSGSEDLARFAGDLDGDGLDEIAVGQSATDARLGAVYVFPGAQPLPGEKSDAWLVVHGEDGVATGVGADLAGVGDLDGDGLDDLAMGSALQTVYEGECLIYLLRADATVSGGVESIGDQDMVLRSGVDREILDITSGAQDPTGDGAPDLVVSGNVIEDHRDILTAWVCAGPAVLGQELSDCSVQIQDDGYYGFSGFDVAGHIDLNGDGVDDLVGAVPWVEDLESWDYLNDVEGVVLAMDGPVEGDALVSDADHLLWGGDTDERVGLKTELGDVNGDGYDDFMAVGDADDAGYVVHGPLLNASETLPSVAADTITDTAQYADVQQAGDVYGDGTANFIVQGQKYASDVGDTIPFYVVPSDQEGTVSVEDAHRTALLCQGDCLESEGQETLAGMGDRDGNGLADLLVGMTPGVYDRPVVLYYVPGAGG